MIGLHTNYQGPQMDFAQAQLLANKHIDLVTLSIGGNDLSILQKKCALQGPALFSGCVMEGLEPVLEAYAKNLTEILTRIRVNANYKGTLVLVTYYSPSADPQFIGAVGALNEVMVAVGARFDAKIADGFLAFQIASAFHGGDPCTAGLLVRFPDGTCDIHPSARGRDLIAAAVLVATEAKIKR